MQLEWLNTVFDESWQPSDWLENKLSELDTIVAGIYMQLDHAQGTDLQQLLPWLPEVIALQACRHPDVLMSTHRKAGELAQLIADAPLHDTETGFLKTLLQLGLCEADAHEIYHIASKVNPDDAASSASRVKALSPQDPRLPMTDALLALNPIAKALGNLSWEIIDSPPGSTFVLGDTPLAQSRLCDGFIVPLSKIMAIRAYPTNNLAAISRRTATTEEVHASNKEQWDMARDIVVGPDSTVLQALGHR